MSNISSTFSGVAALFSALFAGAVWLTHRERLRLDLYNLRFSIYSRTLDLYHPLSGWEATPAEKTSTTSQDSPELEKALRAFPKAIIEAQLLFDDDSGI